MRILWLVNHTMPSLSEKLNINMPTSGGWLVSLSEGLAKKENVELYIICPGSKLGKYKIKDINYITIPVSYQDKFYKVSKKFSDRVNNLILDIKPDIIHVQGTEFCFNSVLLEMATPPKVFSIQGLISEITIKKYNLVGLGKLSFLTRQIEKLRILRDHYRSKNEIMQIRTGSYFIGRTLWDEAHTYFKNPTRKYFYSPETIRDDFFNYKWDVSKKNKHTIFCAGGFGSPLKGFHNILEAASILKRDFPNLKIIVPGSNLLNQKKKFGYKSDLKRIILKLGLKNSVIFTGSLNSNEMANHFVNSHIYLMGSSIENSSNTLCEAMCVGIPSVVPFVGGVPSLAANEIDALHYQSNDSTQAAWQIKRLFESDELCTFISKNALNRSQKTYKNNNIASNVHSIYSEIIQDNSFKYVK